MKNKKIAQLLIFLSFSPLTIFGMNEESVVVFDKFTGLHEKIPKEKAVFVWDKATGEHMYIPRKDFEKHHYSYSKTDENAKVEFFNRTSHGYDTISIRDTIKKKARRGKKFIYHHSPRPLEIKMLNFATNCYENVPVTKTKRVINSTSGKVQYFYCPQNEEDLQKKYKHTDLKTKKRYNQRFLRNGHFIQKNTDKV